MFFLLWDLIFFWSAGKNDNSTLLQTAPSPTTFADFAEQDATSPMAQEWRICQQCRRRRRHGCNPWVGKIHQRRAWWTILAWRVPWKEEPGRQQSMGSQRVRHNWSDLHTCIHSQYYLLNISNLYPFIQQILISIYNMPDNPLGTEALF